MKEIMRIAAATLGATAMVMSMVACSADDKDAEPTREQAAENAYYFSYPMVAREVTRRLSTNVPTPTPIGEAPMNQLGKVLILPDDTFTTVVRTNVDTLYAQMHYDVSAEPLVIRVPAMKRFHLLPILDAWTNVVHSPGSRTVKNADQGYEVAITGPNWKGTLPPGVLQQAMPTDAGWVIGRFQIDGNDDLPAAAKDLEGIKALPLSAHGTDYQSPTNGPVNPSWPKNGSVLVNDFLAGLTQQQYWDLFYETQSHDQTVDADKKTLEQLQKTVGWSPTTKFDFAALSPADQQMWNTARERAMATMRVKTDKKSIDGWQTDRTTDGNFGSDFRTRGIIAYQGIGYNLLEDSVYSFGFDDASGQPLNASKRYVMHFEKDELPPVRAFWSITIYNPEGFFVKNPINRFAVRGEQLRANPDGSVDIYIQSTDPGGDKTQNWLPAPASGDFNALARFYWPERALLDGAWNPPGITAVP